MAKKRKGNQSSSDYTNKKICKEVEFVDCNDLTSYEGEEILDFSAKCGSQERPCEREEMVNATVKCEAGAMPEQDVVKDQVGPESEEYFTCTDLADFEIDEIDYLPNLEDFSTQMKIEVEEHQLQEEIENIVGSNLSNFTAYKVKCEDKIEEHDRGNKTTEKAGLPHTKSNTDLMDMMRALNHFESYNPFNIPIFRDQSTCSSEVMNSRQCDAASQPEQSPQVMQCKECKQIKLSVQDCLEHTSECDKVVNTPCRRHRNLKDMTKIFISKFQCPFCTSQFSSKSSCVLHIGTTHSKENNKVKSIFKRCIDLFFCVTCCSLYHEKQLGASSTTKVDCSPTSAASSCVIAELGASTTKVDCSPTSAASSCVIAELGASTTKVDCSPTSASSSRQELQKYECPHCERLFPNLTDIRIHLQTHYSATSVQHDKPVNKNKLDAIKPHFYLLTQFKCPACPIIFNSTSHVLSHNLYAHKNISLSPKYYKHMKFVCKNCNIACHSQNECLLHKGKCKKISRFVTRGCSTSNSVSASISILKTPETRLNSVSSVNISKSNCPTLIAVLNTTIKTPEPPVTIRKNLAPIPNVPANSTAGNDPELKVINPTPPRKLMQSTADADVELPGTSTNARSSVTSAQIRYKCPVCVQHYSSKSSCQKHLQRKHPDFENKLSEKFEIVPVYECRKCNAICTSRQQYEFHISGCMVLVKNRLTVRRFFCPRCKHHYSNMKLCVDHIKLNHPLHCNTLIRQITSTLFDACDSKFGFNNKLLESKVEGDNSEGEDEDVDVTSDLPCDNAADASSLKYDDTLKQDPKLFLRPVVVLQHLQTYLLD